MAITELTDSQKLSNADLEGSGAAQNHAPNLKTKVNAIVDKVNEAVADANDRIVGSVADVDLKDGGTTDYTIALGGTAGKKFVPTKVGIELDAATALNADGKVKIGKTLGGEEVLAELTLTGLDTVGEVYRATPADGVFDIDADSTIHVQVSSADSGTSGTATVTVIGFEI